MTATADAAAGTQDTLSSRRRGLLLALLCAGVFMVYLDTTVVSVALPALRADLGGDVAILQWVVDAYVLTFACLLLSAGALGDLLGRRGVFLTGLAGFTAASIGCALAPTAGLLLAARAVQGVFGAALVPVSLALVAGLHPEPAARARAIGVWAGVGGLALAAGPVLGGLLTQRLGWPSVFWLNVPIGVVVFTALVRLLPHAPVVRGRRLDPPGQALFALGIATLTWALIEGGPRGWAAPSVLTGFSVAALALVGFLLWEARSPTPLLPLDLIRERVVAVACTANLLSLSGFYIALFLLTLHLQAVQHLSAIATGLRFLALTAAVMLASYAASGLAARAGSRWPAVAGGVGATAGLLGLTTIGPGSGFLGYAWALILLGAGVSFVGAPATVALLAAVPPARAGTASGISNTFRQLGAVLGVALAGALAGTPPATGANAEAFIGGMHTSFLVAAAGTVLGVFAALALPGRPRSARQQPTSATT